METRESIARATATSGGAVVFAGCTVMVALLSLAVVHIPLVTTLGYTSALVVGVAILAAMTLLPALLAIVGDRIDRLRIPLPHGKSDGHPHGWLRWGEFVARHPLPSALFAIVVLVALALPALDLYLGQQDNAALPESTDARRASDGLTAGFGPGTNGPLLISVNMTKQPAKADQKNLDKLSSDEKDQKDKAKKQASAQEQQIAGQLEAQGVPPDQAQAQAQSQVQPQLQKQLDKITKQSDAKRKQLEQTATDPRLQTLKKDIKNTSGVKKVSEPLVNSKGTAAVLNATPTTAPSDRATADLVERLRDDTIPKATAGTAMSADVGGTTAGYVDLAAEISSRLIITIAVVLGLSFLLLMLAFRSVVIPLTAGLMNLVSIGAAFGVVTAVFEKGWGASLVGLEGEVPIVSFVPLMMFAILFGLSMDYEVFLMTHIKEAWKKTPRQPVGRRHRDRHDRPGDHLGGADHGQRVLRVHHQRRPDGQAVRRRHGRRRGGRRDAGALPARALGDAARSVARTGGSRAGWTGSSRTSRSRGTSGSASATPRARRRRRRRSRSRCPDRSDATAPGGSCASGRRRVRGRRGSPAAGSRPCAGTVGNRVQRPSSRSGGS